MGIKHRREGGLPTVVIDRQGSLQAGLMTMGIIQARTFDQGRGLDDKRHVAYTKAYARLRAKAGLQVSPPNLTRTGRMRRAFRVLWVWRDRAALGLAGDAAVYGRFVGEKRPWLGTSPRDRKKIRKRLPRIVLAAIRRGRRP